MNLDQHLQKQLKAFHLGGILESLDLRLQQAQSSSLGYIEFLQLVVQDEIERREAKKLQLRLSRASFEEEKSFEGFDYSFNPKLNAKFIRDLGNCTFIERREHVLLYGPAGVGKSHIAQPSVIRHAVSAMTSSSSRLSNSSVSFWQGERITPGKSGSKNISPPIFSLLMTLASCPSVPPRRRTSTRSLQSDI
jgi:hypothetical protein